MKWIRDFGLIDERTRDVGAPRSARCVLPSAQNQREVEMTIGAERRQIFRKLMFEPLVGAVMDLQFGLLRACIADAATHA